MGRGMGSGMCLLWLLLSMDMALIQSNIIPESGSADIPVSVPDTITELSAQMSGAGPRGLGLLSPVSLKTPEPFFIEVTLPYSVTRGEIFAIKASIFNVLSQPMKVTSSMPSSDQFQINNSKTSENSFCLPGGAKRTLSWDVTPNIKGQVNITFIVEAVKSGEECGEQETVIPKKGSRHVAIQSILVLVPESSDATEKATIVVLGQKKEGTMTEFSSKELTTRKKNSGTFIQMDKVIYKPGEKVSFRLVTMDQDMAVLNKTYPLVELQDPQKNRLAQWKDVHAESRIAELSYQLPPETQTGTYNIKVGDTKFKFFVDEYVLPNYEVNIEVPSFISTKDGIFSFSVSGKYTYGKKVLP